MDADPDGDMETLYGLHGAELRRFLMARVGDAAEAEDLLQEIWLRVRQRPEGPVGNGRAYLFRIAQNLVVDRLRERQRRMARDRRWSDEVTDFSQRGDDPADQDRSAEEQMIVREEVALLASAIANLPDGAQRAFRLHKLEGLSHAEVAERLGISRSGVEKHMALAMKYLRAALDGWGKE